MLKIVDVRPVVQPCSVAACAHFDCTFPQFSPFEMLMQIDCVFID